MSGYVIKRTDQGGGYLGHDPGNTGETWVRDLSKARRFPTEEAADEERCPQNEVVVPVESLLKPMH